MIHHVCMFKLQQDDHEAVLQKALELAEPLHALPSTKGGKTVVNASCTPENNYDLCLIYDFETIDDLNAYQNDPIHLTFKNYVVEHMVSRACIDYEK